MAPAISRLAPSLNRSVSTSRPADGDRAQVSVVDSIMAGYSWASWAIWWARNGCITKDTPPPFDLPSTTFGYTPRDGPRDPAGPAAPELGRPSRLEHTA